MTQQAPRRKFAHLNGRIRNAGGTLGNSRAGTIWARLHKYKWVDNDGHSSSDNWPFNMHGAPFNPMWLKRGKLESYTAEWIEEHHPKLRSAEATFRQNAAANLGTEWEVKDLHPVASPADLELYFTRLADAAREAYGPRWRKRVEVKVLSNLGGGLTYAKKVLRHAHEAGFTTIILPRGKHRRLVIDEVFIDYRR